MPPASRAEPRVVEKQNQALDDHCRDFGIIPSEISKGLVRESVAARIAILYGAGIHSVEGLKKALRFDRSM